MSAVFVAIEWKSPGYTLLHKSESRQSVEHAVEAANRYAPYFKRGIYTIPDYPAREGNLGRFCDEYALQSVLYHGDGLYQRNPTFMPDSLATITKSLQTDRNLFVICEIVKRTCKALGIKPTWKAMRAFVREVTP